MNLAQPTRVAHPISKAFEAIASSVQLILDHFGLDGGFLLARQSFSRSQVSGVILRKFGRSFGVLNGDEVRIAPRYSQFQDNPTKVINPSSILASLLVLDKSEQPLWLEVNNAFHVGPIRLMAALSIMPELHDLNEHQLIIYDTQQSIISSEEISLALLGIGPLVAQIIADGYIAARREIQTSIVLSEAERDPLTDVLNRFGWERAIDHLRSEKPGSIYSVVTFDLDNLKIINDTSGHSSGDRYIAKFAQVLKNAVRDNDMVARVGGDEFAILAPKMNASSARDFSLRIEQQLIAAGVSASIGHASGMTPFSIERLLEESDRMMYQSKRYKKTIAMTGTLF